MVESPDVSGVTVPKNSVSIEEKINTFVKRILGSSSLDHKLSSAITRAASRLKGPSIEQLIDAIIINCKKSFDTWGDLLVTVINNTSTTAVIPTKKILAYVQDLAKSSKEKERATALALSGLTAERSDCAVLLEELNSFLSNISLVTQPLSKATLTKCVSIILDFSFDSLSKKAPLNDRYTILHPHLSTSSNLVKSISSDDETIRAAALRASTFALGLSIKNELSADQTAICTKLASVLTPSAIKGDAAAISSALFRIVCVNPEGLKAASASLSNSISIFLVANIEKASLREVLAQLSVVALHLDANCDGVTKVAEAIQKNSQVFTSSDAFYRSSRSERSAFVALFREIVRTNGRIGRVSLFSSSTAAADVLSSIQSTIVSTGKLEAHQSTLRVIIRFALFLQTTRPTVSVADEPSPRPVAGNPFAGLNNISLSLTVQLLKELLEEAVHSYALLRVRPVMLDQETAKPCSIPPPFNHAALRACLASILGACKDVLPVEGQTILAVLAAHPALHNSLRSIQEGPFKLLRSLKKRFPAENHKDVLRCLTGLFQTAITSPRLVSDLSGIAAAVVRSFNAPLASLSSNDLQFLLDTFQPYWSSSSLVCPSLAIMSLLHTRDGQYWHEDDIFLSTPKIPSFEGLKTKSTSNNSSSTGGASSAKPASSAPPAAAAAKAKAKAKAMGAFLMMAPAANSSTTLPPKVVEKIASIEVESSSASSSATLSGDLYDLPEAIIHSTDERKKIVIGEQITARSNLTKECKKALSAFIALSSIIRVAPSSAVSLAVSLVRNQIEPCLVSPLTFEGASLLLKTLLLSPIPHGLPRGSTVNALEAIGYFRYTMALASREVATLDQRVYSHAVAMCESVNAVLSPLGACLVSVVACHIIETVALGGPAAMRDHLETASLCARCLATQATLKAPLDSGRVFTMTAVASTTLATVLSAEMGVILRELSAYGIGTDKNLILLLAKVGLCQDANVRNNVGEAFGRAANAGADLTPIAAHIRSMANDNETPESSIVCQRLVQRFKEQCDNISVVFPQFRCMITSPSTSSIWVPLLSKGLAQLVIAATDKLNAADATKLTQETMVCLFNDFKASNEASVRFAIVSALIEISSHVAFAIVPTSVRITVDFVLNDAVEAVVEPTESVRDGLFNLVSAAVSSLSAKEAATLYKHIDSIMTSKKAPRHPILFGLAVPVILACIARRLESTDSSIVSLISRLFTSLFDPNAPSVDVQKAIAKVLPPLIATAVFAKSLDAQKEFEGALKVALDGSTRPVRIGGSLGVAAIIKGVKSPSIRHFDLLPRLRKAAEDNKDAAKKQGALYTFKALVETLGCLFEPYVEQALPSLLNALADPHELVRIPAQEAATSFMAIMSNHGIKLVLPDLVAKAKDGPWRTKLGALELLGAMSACAPRQLAASLPQIMPAVVGAIADPHNKVVEGARAAIRSITDVINNPEVKDISDSLVLALTDPLEKNQHAALENLLQTAFIHAICAPSLALICPVITRALRGSDSSNKKKAAQVLASMMRLVKRPEVTFMPYLNELKPHIQSAIIDPLPDVRFVAAKALGTLMKGLGEQRLHMIDWLFDKLQSAESSVERSGAANALSEVLVSIDRSLVPHYLNRILTVAQDTTTPKDTKEGYLGMFVFLPAALGEDFSPHVQKVLAALLLGLSDEHEAVRDVSLRAAQVIIRQFGNTHTAFLLPPLEEGTFADDWRLRVSSVNLLGTLVSEVLRDGSSGVDVMLVAGHTGGDGLNVLSRERRMFVLSSLYIAKNDENRVVRNTAGIHWKALVQNTPRTLRELLPILMERLTRALSSSSRAKQRTASACLGDIVEKLGDKVLPELIPVFMDQLQKGDASARYGVCLGLAEVLDSASRTLIINYLPDLLPAIVKALSDEDFKVRQAASRCACALLENQTNAAVPVIIPGLLRAICCPSVHVAADMKGVRGSAIDGLRLLVLNQHAIVAPALLKLLCKDEPGTGIARHIPDVLPEDPLDVSRIYAFAAISSIPTPHTLAMSAGRMVNSFRAALCAAEVAPAENALELRTAVYETAKIVINKIETDSLHITLSEAFAAIKIYQAISDFTATGINKRRRLKQEKRPHNEIEVGYEAQRAAACRVLGAVFEAAQNDAAPFLPQAVSTLLPVALADIAPSVRSAAADSLMALSKSVRKEEFNAMIPELQSTLSNLAVDPLTSNRMKGLRFPGFENTSLLETLYPVFQNGLMYGSADIREVSARALGDLVDLSSDAAVKPYVVKMTGPFIRIVGDRFPPGVKAAILDALAKLLKRGGVLLKPFVPQLQTTFAKCLSEASALVRYRATVCLGRLAPLAVLRAEQLLIDLSVHATSPEAEIKLGGLRALRDVLKGLPESATAKLSDPAREQIVFALSTSSTRPPRGTTEIDDETRNTAAQAMALLLVKHRNPEDASSSVDFIRDAVIKPACETTEPLIRAGCVSVLTAIADHEDSWDEIIGELRSDMEAALVPMFTDYNASVRKAIAEFIGMCAFRAARAWNAGDQADEGSFAFDLLLKLAPNCEKNGNGGLAQLTPSMKGIKSFLKRASHGLLDDTLGNNWLLRLCVVLCGAVQTPNPTIKIPAERVLWYALGGPTTVGTNALNPDIMARATTGMDNVTKGFLVEYGRRVLARFAAETVNSDDEDTGKQEDDEDFVLKLD